MGGGGEGWGQGGPGILAVGGDWTCLVIFVFILKNSNGTLSIKLEIITLEWQKGHTKNDTLVVFILKTINNCLNI
jgi:hypothetical protein